MTSFGSLVTYFAAWRPQPIILHTSHVILTPLARVGLPYHLRRPDPDGVASSTNASKQRPNFAAKSFTMVRTRHGSKTEARVEPPATLPKLSPAPNTKLPAQLRFPLLVLMTWTLFGILWSTISPFIAGDLATVSTSRDHWWNIVGLMVWKAALVAVGWYGGYDSMQVP